jgi:hypothetical protein
MAKRILKGGSSSRQSIISSAYSTLKRSISSVSKRVLTKKITNTSCRAQIVALKTNFSAIHSALNVVKRERGLSQEQKDKLNNTVFNLVLRFKYFYLRFILRKLDRSDGGNLHEYLSIIESLKKLLNGGDSNINLPLIGDCMEMYDLIDLSTREARQSAREKDIVGKKRFVTGLKTIFDITDKDIDDIRTNDDINQYVKNKLETLESFKLYRQSYTLSLGSKATRLQSVSQSVVSRTEVSTAGKKPRSSGSTSGKKPRSSGSTSGKKPRSSGATSGKKPRSAKRRRRKVSSTN